MTTLITTPVKMISPASLANELRVIAIESNPAPPELGGTYSKIDSASMDDAGDVAFSATIEDSTVKSAIFVQSDADTRAFLKAGEATPAGGKYKKFAELDFARFTWQGVEGTFLFFRAELDESSTPEGLFLWTPEKVETIALAGAKSPRGGTYKSFSQPIITATSGSNGVNFFLAFIALMEDDNKSIIQKSSQSDPEEVLATGDKIEGKLVKDFTMSQMGAFVVGCVAQMRRKGDGKRFNEVLIVGPGYLVNGGVLKDGTHFEGVGRVKQIFAPPAIAFQVSFVALRFKNKTGAIVARDVFGSPGIVAKSGDTITGSPDETIESFGPPVVNSRIPISGPQAILSVVRLSTGKSALWAHIFRFGGGTEAETKLILIEGRGDDQGLVLGSFAPLKVTNDGGVLLRGTIGEGNQVRDGVFVIRGLFQ
jgi:hypothetical protein